MIKINNRGESGHPCLIPLEAGKNLEGVPFTNIEKFEDSTQPRIQFTPTKGMSICKRTSLRKVQLTLSKALTKSSLRIIAFFIFYFYDAHDFLGNVYELYDLSMM